MLLTKVALISRLTHYLLSFYLTFVNDDLFELSFES